ncbi:ABC transporter permease [Nakamurella sp. PAMC28650]|jgi:simple sugar transport system permease protein|uniref:ABC transporter permease n=1 Tax=Nakamurella sp. PAMC28650 TaxID=2762325 RepID=UPI00164E5593|nr:ABC transporter permease [Nakamurella sp. PAMC28650]QNK81003.1 ABC transporter permease [Nakamurella sp. PAMC28650]
MSLTKTPRSTSAPVPAGRASQPLMQRALGRPEIGALIAAILIYVFFFIVAPPFRYATSFSTVLYASSQVGIVAVAVGMLMIGGEFDLSAGVAFITSGLTASMVSYQLTVNMWVGTGVALVLSVGIGFINGYLVVKTKIPSFLITLGTFFILQGANLAVTKLITGSVATQDVSNIAGFDTLKSIFAGQIVINGVSYTITIVWWFVFVAIATWVLARTRVGNWIFAVGGNPDSARAVGVPVDKVKIGLFMMVGFLAWFYGQHRLYGFNTIQAGEGVGQEFIFIIAAVVGGTLLTGGFGSAIGTAIGAFIFGMVTQGIVYAGWDPNWFKAFLGVMLLLAVAVNLYVKKLSTTRKNV